LGLEGQELQTTLKEIMDQTVLLSQTQLRYTVRQEAEEEQLQEVEMGIQEEVEEELEDLEQPLEVLELSDKDLQVEMPSPINSKEQEEEEQEESVTMQLL
jgi:hypothetical protein